MTKPEEDKMCEKCAMRWKGYLQCLVLDGKGIVTVLINIHVTESMEYKITDITDITFLQFEGVKWINMNQDLVQCRAAV